MTKPFPEVISGIRTAKRGVEVREDIAQMGEYVEQFAATATEKAEAAASSEKKASDAVANIDQQTKDAVAAVNTAETKALQDVETARTGTLTDIGNARSWAVQAVTDTKSAALTALEEKRAAALQEMQASVDAAAGSAEKAATSEGNAKESENAAKASKEAAAQSETNSAASESAAQKSAEEAAASAALAGTRAGTDKTLSIPDAPADAKQVGDALAVMYTKEEIQKLIEDSLAAYRAEEYAKIKYWISDDPTSPAELFGGTWEQIAADRALMGASTAHPAGSTAEAGLPNVTGSITEIMQGSAVKTSGAFSTTGSDAKYFIAYSDSYINAKYKTIGFNASSCNSIYGKSSTVQPPAYYTYIWRRIE